MKVDFIAFADFAATDSSGKMTIVGLFDRINTVARPTLSGAARVIAPLWAKKRSSPR